MLFKGAVCSSSIRIFELPLLLLLLLEGDFLDFRESNDDDDCECLVPRSMYVGMNTLTKQHTDADRCWIAVMSKMKSEDAGVLLVARDDGGQ